MANLKYQNAMKRYSDSIKDTSKNESKYEQVKNIVLEAREGSYKRSNSNSSTRSMQKNYIAKREAEMKEASFMRALDLAKTGGANIKTTPYELAVSGATEPMRYVRGNNTQDSVKNSFKAETKIPYKRTGLDIDQSVIDDVNGMIKDRSVGQKIGDFFAGNHGYTDRYTGEHLASGKEKRITDHLKEKYGLTDEAALQISKNWGTIQTDQEKENAANWYNEREKEYNALPEDIKERLEGFYNQSKSPEAFMLNAEIKALENQGYDARNLYEYVKRKNEIKENKDMQKSVEEAGKVKNFGENILATGATIGQFNDALEQLGYTLSNGSELMGYKFPDIPYDPSAAKFTNYKDAVRGETTGRIDNKVGKKAYQIGTSMADSALAMGLGALTGTEAVSLATMSAGAAASAYNEATERGLSKGKAAGTAMANGVFEALFEKVSLDHFLKLARTEGKVGVKNAVKDILAQSGVEGSEEVFTSIADEMADRIINTDMSDYDMKIEEYMRDGMTAEEAKGKATKEFGLQLADDFVSGAVSGLGFGAIAKGVSNHRYKNSVSNMGTDTTDSLYETAKNAPEGSTAREIADTVEKDNLTAKDKAKMVESLDALQAEDAKNTFTERVAEKISPEVAEKATSYYEGYQSGKLSGEEFVREITNNVADNSQERAAIIEAASQSTQIETTMQQIDQEKSEVNRMAETYEDKNTQKVYEENYAKSGLDLQEYTSTFNKVLNSAMSGETLEEFTKSNPIMAHNISAESLVKMYSHAENLAEAKIKAFTNKAQREVAVSWAKELGVNVEFVDSPKENGHYENGTIYISNQSINPMGVVFAHEFTHYLSDNHPDLYASLKAQSVDFFKATETGNGLYAEMRSDIMARYADELKAWEANGKLDANIDEEITAHMTEAVMEHLANMTERDQRAFADRMYKQDRNLFEKFVDFLKDALEKIKKTLKGYRAESKEARALLQYQQQLEAVTKTFTEANAEVKRRNSVQGEEKTKEMQDVLQKMKSKKAGIENEIKNWYNTTSREQRLNEGGFFNVGTTSEVADLNRQELETVDRILNAILTQVSNENSVVSEQRSESIYELSEQAKKEVRASRGFNDTSNMSRMLNSYQSMALNFGRLMDRTFGYEDDSVGKTITKLMEDGEIRKLSFERDVDYLFDDVIGGTSKAERKKIRAERLQFEGKNKKGKVDTSTWVTLPSYRGGNSAKVPASMRMSLIMHLMNEDNIRHIAYGGFNIPNLTEYERGNIKAAYDRGTIYKIPFFDDEEVKEYRKKAESFESWDGEYRVNKSNPLYIAYQNAKEDADNLRKSNYKDSTSYEIAKKELTEKREAAWKAYQDGREEAYRGLNRLLKQRVDEYLDKLTRDLTDYEKKFLADSKEFFWNMSGERINEVTMKLYGYEKANVKHYFPINVDSNSIITDDPQVKFDGTLEGSGFLKNRIHSRKPILVEDITKVVQRQTGRVSQFYGFATAVRDAKAILGYSTDGNSLRSEIMHKWGSSGAYTTAPMAMIDKTISDIETGGDRLRDDVFGKIFRKVSSNYAGAVLMGNFGVTIKQAASAPNAAAVVGWKNLNEALAQNPFFAVHNPDAVAEIEKRTPLMRYREKGYSIPEIGDIQASKEYGSAVGAFTGMITGMDVRTVRMLEYAAVAWGNNDSGLAKGSEQYWNAVTDKFNEIVRKTQPNYTLLERPEFLRSQNALWKTLFMFKTQPVQNYGMLYDAVGNYAAKKAKYGKGSKQVQEASLNLARAVTSNLVSQVVYSLMSLASKLFYHSVGDLLKDDDDKEGEKKNELDWNKVGGYLLETFLSSEAGMIAGGSELFEYLSSKITGSTYYGVSDSITSALNDVTDGIDKFSNSIEKLAEAKTEEQHDKAVISLKYSARSLGTRIGVLMGVPVNNIYKPINSMVSYAQDIKNRDTWSGKGILHGDTSGVQSQYDRIFDAVESDNLKRAKELQQQLIEDSEANDPEDSVANNIKQKIGEAYKEKEMTEAEARKNLGFVEPDTDKIDSKIENWDLAVIKKNLPEGYTVDQLSKEVNKQLDEKKAQSAITSEIKSRFKDGKLSDKEAMKYLEKYNYVEDEDEAWFTIESWKYDSKYGRYYDELDNMIAAGSTNRKKLVDICAEYKKHGAEGKNIVSGMASKYKEAYLEATGSKKATLNSCLLNALYAAGYSGEDARARLKRWTEKEDK